MGLAKALEEAGAFVPADLEKRSIMWNGSTFDVYIRRLSFGVVEDMLAGANGDTRGRSSRMIAAAVCDEKGDPVMTFDDAYRLRSSLAKLLADAIREVNELGEAQG